MKKILPPKIAAAGPIDSVAVMPIAENNKKNGRKIISSTDTVRIAEIVAYFTGSTRFNFNFKILIIQNFFCRTFSEIKLQKERGLICLQQLTYL